MDIILRRQGRVASLQATMGRADTVSSVDWHHILETPAAFGKKMSLRIKPHTGILEGSTVLTCAAPLPAW